VVLGLLAACAEPEDSGGPQPFEVVGVSPADGATGIVESASAELRLSAGLDELTCPPSQTRIDALGPDGTVAFTVAVARFADATEQTLRLDPSDPLPRGWTYAVSLRGGTCASQDGRPLEPFSSTFTVAP